jgi:hypothetical protein
VVEGDGGVGGAAEGGEGAVEADPPRHVAGAADLEKGVGGFVVWQTGVLARVTIILAMGPAARSAVILRKRGVILRKSRHPERSEGSGRDRRFVSFAARSFGR